MSTATPATPGWLLLAAASPPGLAPLAIFALYTVLVLVLAGYANRLLNRSGFVEEYFLGRRGLGVVAFTLTFGATAASAGTFAGFPALIYTHGWSLALWIAGYMAVPLCGMALLGKRLNQVARKSNAVTLPDVLRDRFASSVPATIGIAVLVLLQFFYLIPQFKLGALILQQLLGDVPLLHWAGALAGSWLARAPGLAAADPEYLVCLLLFGLSVVAYTTFGGFRAVVWTDVLQGFVMLVGVLLLLALALARTGGLEQATRAVAEMTPPEIGTAVLRREPAAADPSDGATRRGRVRIPADAWIEADAPQPGQPAWLLRTNEPAILDAAGFDAVEVKVVRITTPAEIARIRAAWGGGSPLPLPPGVAVGEIRLRPYAAGAGAAGVYAHCPGPSPRDAAGFLPLGLAISFFAYWPFSGAGQPAALVRLMAFDSTRTLRRSVLGLSIYFGCIYLPLVVIFCAARVILPGLDQTPDRIMPALTFELSEWARMPWLAGVLIAAPFAAAMSTVDSIVLVISSCLVRDIYQRGWRPGASDAEIQRLSYGCTLLIGMASMLGAANPPDFLQYLIVFAGGGLAATFLVPIALAIYWPRMNAAGMSASMLAGLAAYLAFYLIGYLQTGTNVPYRLASLDPLVWGLAASLAAGGLVSRATRPLPARLVNFYFARGE